MRGLLYLKQGNDSLAIEALEAALSASRYLEEGPSLARNPEWRYTTYKELGLTYDRLGRPSKAIGALEAALEASEKMGPPGIAEVKAALKRLR
jgi:tetratricopeptide (TPR) repeat protein